MPLTTSELRPVYHYPHLQQPQQRGSRSMDPSIPAYPQATRQQRRKKRSKRRSKQQQKRQSNSSSSEDAYKRNSMGFSKRLPILEETPQVLLWHSSEEAPGEDRNAFHTNAIFRQPPMARQGPDALDEQGEPSMDLLGPCGPKWFEWEYWKERLSTRCCLPGPSTQKPREPLLDYRPSFLGRYDDEFYHEYGGPEWASQQQHYYVVPWPPPQVSPLTEAGIPFAFSTAQEEINTVKPETMVDSLREDAEMKSTKASKKRHHRKNSSLLGSHFEAPSSELQNELPPVMDLQSVSSLDSVQSSSQLKTPRQLQTKLVLPDTNSSEKSKGGARSNRNKDQRMGHSRIVSSPRNLPPVPPRRSKHKSQVTNSTMASTALPLPSPGSNASANNSPRDLARSYSEASANTTGSRHRRGGTVTEFSFESMTRPSTSTARCTSLPLEVQVQMHIPDKEERPPIRLVDSKDSWGVTPPRAYFQQHEEETPTGYISPLEEEEEAFTRRTILDRSPGNRTNTNNSEAYAADIDDSPEASTGRNPQDSLCGDDSIRSGDEENDPPFEQTSPFAKLKLPPAIPAGESWMWSWVNKSTVDTPKAVTPTKSPSFSDASSIVETRRVKRQMSVKTEYLPKNTELEDSWRNLHADSVSQGIAVSGWLAFGLGEQMVKKLTVEGKNLDPEDVVHVVLPNGSEEIWISKSDGTFDAVDLCGCRVEVNEISRKHGRTLFLKRIDSGETVCTLLPVSLPVGFTGNEKHFGDGSICFPSGSYLPDDQQYTTMHIMFALDAMLKAKQSIVY